MSKRIYNLADLAEDYGYEDVGLMMEEYLDKGICPAICIECGWTTDYEPDQDKGYCEQCGRNTVKSMFILAGVI